MRLDKFLKVSRVIKRRTIANEACDAGRVSINGKVAKASTEVKVGDLVEIVYGNKIIRFEIVNINEIANKVSAEGMIKIQRFYIRAKNPGIPGRIAVFRCSAGKKCDIITKVAVKGA